MNQSLQSAGDGLSMRTLLQRHFYFAMALLMIAVVGYGFSRTIDANLIHPAVPRPLLLSIHGLVFAGWLAMFATQAALIRSRRIRLHKQLGQAGVVLGAAVVLVGLSTAVVMTRFHFAHVVADAPPPSFLIVPLNDMLAFGSLFVAAVLMRRQPEYHRRLMLMATAALTAAGWGRFPEYLVPGPLFYVGVDLIVLLGMARDAAVSGRIHRVYFAAWPLMLLGQIAAVAIVMASPPWWLAIVRAIGTA